MGHYILIYLCITFLTIGIAKRVLAGNADGSEIIIGILWPISLLISLGYIIADMFIGIEGD